MNFIEALEETNDCSQSGPYSVEGLVLYNDILNIEIENVSANLVLPCTVEQIMDNNWNWYIKDDDEE